jgi:hypothetical protein
MMLKSSKRVLLFIIIFCASSYNLWRDWQGNRHPFISDVAQYYSYIQATFIEHDLSFSFATDYGIPTAPNGTKVPKMSMGLALIYTPMFLVCHTLAQLSGQPANGFSEFYAYGMYYGAMLFIFWGLFVLRRTLLLFYTEKITSLTLLSVFLGTNLLYYTISFNLLTHGFLFTLNCLLVFYTIKWYNSFKSIFIIGIGFIIGLSILIRPTSIFILFIPALWGCFTIGDIRQRLQLLWSFRLILFIALLVGLTPWIPQVTYWKIYTGDYFYYSYGQEGFNFLKPNLINVLFSFRKGWLLYTPIMMFALVGFYFLYKQRSKIFIPLVISFPLTVYVLASWWCWSWGGSFSIRAFVEYYAFLAFPMAAFFAYLMETIHFKKPLIGVITLLILFNLLQTYQYTRVIIHWDNMSKDAYLYSLGKFNYTKEQREHFNTLLAPHSDEVPEDYKRKK